MNSMKISFFKRLLIGRLVLSLMLIGLPLSAQASVFSFVAGLFSENTIIEGSFLVSSQNMPLLQASLNSDPNPAKGGGNITIVEGTSLLSETGPSGSMADISDQPNSDKISVYVVREGDSLSQIAKMFNVSVNTVIWANDLHKSLIKEGQTLVILPVSGVKHTIASGETLASISKKYGGDSEEIMNFNNITKETKLVAGETIVIPDGDMGSYSYGVTSSGVVAKGAGGPSYSSYYIRPTTGVRTQGIHGYNAIDIGTPVGTPIVASASGKVIISKNSGWNGGYGSYVVISHENGSQTLYGHMSDDIVYVGQWVVQGQVIGYTGNTGKSTGPHLHFEIRGAKNPF